MIDIEKKPRWSWKAWLALVEAQIQDADALELARALPGYTKGQKSRAFVCYELMYQRNAPLKGWQPHRTCDASVILKRAGFLSACPGFGVLFAPVVPAEKDQENGNENPGNP